LNYRSHCTIAPRFAAIAQRRALSATTDNRTRSTSLRDCGETGAVSGRCPFSGTTFARFLIGSDRYDSRLAVTAAKCSAGCVTDPKRRCPMLGLAILFFIIALIAYAIGATGVAGMSAGIGRILLFVFLVLMLLSFVGWLVNGHPNTLWF